MISLEESITIDKHDVIDENTIVEFGLQKNNRMRNELLENPNFDEILFERERRTKGQTSTKI